MASLKDKMAASAAGGRPKTNRQIVIWVLVVSMVALVIYLFATQGSDLGQGKLDKQKAKEQQEKTAQMYQQKVANPDESTQNQLQNARLKVGESEQSQLSRIAGGAPAVSSSVFLPPPSIDVDGELARLNKADKAVNASTPAAQTASFVMFSAQPADNGKSGLTNALAVTPPGSSATASTNVSDSDVADAQSPQARAALQQAHDAQVEKATIEKLSAAKANGIKQPGGERNQAWLFQQRNNAVDLTHPITAVRTNALYWLAPGTVVHFVIEDAIDTSLPGTLVARVTQPVYDSRYGHYLVIPAGSTLKGSYDTSVADGQHRVMLAFDTLVTPAGGMVDLKALAGADALGRGGIPGKLHTHFWSRMGVAGLLAIEATATDRFSKSSDSPNPLFGGGSSGSSGGQILMNVANQEMQQRFATGPNITVKPGTVASLTLVDGISIPPVANAR